MVDGSNSVEGSDSAQGHPCNPQVRCTHKALEPDFLATKAAKFLGILAFCLLCVSAIYSTSLVYSHSWMTGHYLTMARAMANLGFFNIGGMPIQNNGLTTPLDTYLHWPPLSVYFLSSLYKIFGNNPIGYHLLFSFMQLGSSIILAFILIRLGFRQAAWFGGGVYLGAPVILEYGFVVGPTSMAVLLFLLSIMLFVEWESGRRALWPACLAAFGATLTSWEPICGYAGLVATCFFMSGKSRYLRGALPVFVCGCTGVFATLLVYAAQDQALAGKLISRALLRAGLASWTTEYFDVWTIEQRAEPKLSIFYALRTGLKHTLIGLGPVGLIGTAVLAAAVLTRQVPGPAMLSLVLGSLGGYWLVWAAFMNNQYANHEFMIIIASPIAALGAGITFEILLRTAKLSRYAGPHVIAAALIGTAGVSAVITTAEFISRNRTPGKDSVSLVELGEATNNLPKNSVVITPARSAVPLFYSNNIMIRSVRDDHWIIDHWASFRNVCNACSIYVAIMHENRDAFARVIGNMPPAVEREPWMIYRIADPEGNLLAQNS